MDCRLPSVSTVRVAKRSVLQLDSVKILGLQIKFRNITALNELGKINDSAFSCESSFIGTSVSHF